MFKHNIKNLILAILASFAILAELNLQTILNVTGRSTHNFNYMVLALLLYSFFKNHKEKTNYIGFKILATLFSLFMIFGYSYDKLDSWYFVFGNALFVGVSILKFIGFYNLFLIAIDKLYLLIIKFKFKPLKHKVWEKIRRKPLFYSAVFILICWLPYIISYYPIVLSPDPTNQIKQFFGIPTRYIDGIKLINENILLTNDNPILHTMLLGGSVQIGKFLGSDNFGLFIYSLIQITILLSALLYSIKHLIKNKVSEKGILITICIYAFVPIFPMYSINAVKDVIFSSFILIYVIKLFDLIRYDNYKIKNYISLTFIALAVCLSRNNGMYHIILSLPFAIIFMKKDRIAILSATVLSIGVYLIFLNILLPFFQITQGNKREMYSIPFQQTARYVKYYQNELTDEEAKIIDKILVLETLGERYNPIISDPVKNQFNALASEEDWNAYLKLWARQLLKKPHIYIEATLNNIYGYFYPNTRKWYIYYNEYNERLNETGKFNYHYNNLNISRNIIRSYGEAFPRIPIIGMFVNIGFVVWIYFFMTVILIKRKLYKYIVVLLPALSLILVCVASPVNTYFRYVMPYIFTLPATAFLLYTLIKTKTSE